MRDYLYKETKSDGGRNEAHFKELGNLYYSLSPDLREKVGAFRSGNQRLNLPQEWIYKPVYNRESMTRLGNNLVNAEIDIVLETPNFLFIGETKLESGLGYGGSDVLVHQLIRQNVMAWILICERSDNRKVVPFIVRREPEGREQLQVEFMKKQGWLPKGNVLSWEEIASLARAS